MFTAVNVSGSQGVNDGELKVSMGQRNKIIGLVAAAVVSAAGLFSSPAAHAEAGNVAASFLKLGQGARGAAMADAQAAVVDDVTAAYWNPAGLANLRFQELNVMHHDLVEGVRYNQAVYGFPTQTRGAFAVGLSLLDYGSIDGYSAGGTPSSSVEAKNTLLSASWGRKISRTLPLSAGLSVKYLKSDLAGYKASVPMADFGVLAILNNGRFRGMRLAAALRNVGGDVKYDAEGSPLPQQFVLGGGFQALGGALNIALDAVQSKDNGSYFTSGLEYRLFEVLQLRMGYTGLSEFVGNGITYGMGLRFTRWNLDYAFVPYGDLGNSNRLSVGIRFGRALKTRQADEQVEANYQRARRELALGQGVDAYSTVNDLLMIAPWHKPSVELKAKIEKMFEEMSVSRNKARMESEIADTFTNAKIAFDRDELVQAKRGFETILMLQPDHVGSKVYLERIQNRYAGLAQESFKQGMSYYAAGDYDKAKMAFEKTLTIDPDHLDARSQLEKTREIMQDAGRRSQELELLAGAGDAYKVGLEMFQKNDLEGALTKFTEVQLLIPEYEEVARYLDLTKVTLAGVLFEQAQINMDNGQLEEAAMKMKRATQLAPTDSRIATGLKVAERDLEIKNARRSAQLYKDGLEAFLGGNGDKAEELWKKSLELDPSNEETLKAISKIEEQKRYAEPGN